VVLFWAAFILTRPLGATVGDFLDKPRASGGLALDRFGVGGAGGIHDRLPFRLRAAPGNKGARQHLTTTRKPLIPELSPPRAYVKRQACVRYRTALTSPRRGAVCVQGYSTGRTTRSARRRRRPLQGIARAPHRA